MKLIAIISIYLVALLSIVIPPKISSKAIFTVWIVLYLALVYSIHSAEFEDHSDLSNYTNYFNSEVEYSNVFIFREIAYFMLSRGIYLILQDNIMTFIAMDVLFGLMLYKSFLLYEHNSRLQGRYYSIYSAFAYLLFFPIILGYELIFRQLLALILVVTSLAYLENSRKFIGFFWFVVAILFHNVSALFLPLILICYRKNILNIIAVLVMILMPSLLIYSQSGATSLLSRSYVNYLPTLSITFFLVFMFILAIACYVNSEQKINHLFYKIVITVLIYFISFFSLESNLHIERIGLFCFGIIYFYINNIVDASKDKTFFRLIIFHLSLIPLVTFYRSILIT